MMLVHTGWMVTLGLIGLVLWAISAFISRGRTNARWLMTIGSLLIGVAVAVGLYDVASLYVSRASASASAAGGATPTPIVIVVTPTPGVGAASFAEATATPGAVAASGGASAASESTATPPPAVPTSVPTPAWSTEALKILAEVDKVYDEITAAGYVDYRFETVTGDVASLEMPFQVSGAWSGRVACDDKCTGFWLLRARDGKAVEIKPDKTYGSNFNYAALPAAEKDTAAKMGVNVVASEILEQHLFTTKIAVSPGDMLVIWGQDTKGVNKGVFASWLMK